MSYFNCCGMCKFCNLYNKNGSHFKCTEVSGRWVLATESKCSRFQGDGSRSERDIDEARKHTYGL